MQQQTPVMVMNTNSKRETGRKTQYGNIQAAKVNNLHRDSILVSLNFKYF